MEAISPIALSVVIVAVLIWAVKVILGNFVGTFKALGKTTKYTGNKLSIVFTKKGRLALKRASTQNKISKLQVKENKAAKAKSEAHKKLDKLNRDFDVYR